MLPKNISDAFEHTGLCTVFAEGRELHLRQITQLQGERIGHGRRRRQLGAVPNRDERSVRVIELLRPVRSERIPKLLRKELPPSRPVEGSSGGQGNNGVIAVQVDASVSTESENHLRAHGTNAFDDDPNESVEILPRQFSIRIVEDLAAVDTKDFTSRREFRTAQASEI